MAETPNGDTASPTDAPDSVQAEPIRLGGASRPGDDSAPGGTIAGDVGEDHLAPAVDADAAAGPWSPAAPDTVGGDSAGRTSEDEPAAASRPGGLRRTLILVILLALVIGGGYASYPMWRAEVEPLARQLGIALPAVEPPQAPETAKAPETAAPPSTQAPSTPAPGTPAPQR